MADKKDYQGANTQDAPGVARLVAAAALRWLFALLLFSVVGFVACAACYAFLAPTLWHAGPGIPAARAGGFGAVLVLVLMLFLPVGYIGVLYLVGLPALFAFLGHQFGVRAALGHLADKKCDGLAAFVAARIWPMVLRLSTSGKVGAAGSTARALLAGSNEPGLSRRILGWVLSAAKVPELVTSTEFLARVKMAPEPARTELQAHLSRAIREWGRTPLLPPLALLLALLALLTTGLRFWFG